MFQFMLFTWPTLRFGNNNTEILFVVDKIVRQGHHYRAYL